MLSHKIFLPKDPSSPLRTISPTQPKKSWLSRKKLGIENKDHMLPIVVEPWLNITYQVWAHWSKTWRVLWGIDLHHRQKDRQNQEKEQHVLSYCLDDHRTSEPSEQDILRCKAWQLSKSAREAWDPNTQWVWRAFSFSRLNMVFTSWLVMSIVETDQHRHYRTEPYSKTPHSQRIRFKCNGSLLMWRREEHFEYNLNKMAAN